MRNILIAFLLILISNVVFTQTNSATTTTDNWKQNNFNKKIYAFVGEKIYIENYIKPQAIEDYKINVSEGDTLRKPFIQMDYGYKAKYKVIKNVNNEIKASEVEFIAFDHHGIPPFSKGKNALLFLIKENEKFYHCKYQYFEVFKTSDNKWAGIYDKIKYKNTTIKPVKIDFKADVTIILNDYLKKHRYFLFPKKYFKHIDNKVVTNYGNYVEDLFSIKKEGILKARGYFK